jgi:microcystin-dependent protein
LAVASGGTGVTTSTGTGSTVLSASPTFTGTPVAPTAAAGTNTTQIATTAFVTTGLQAAYPVGSIYMATVATNPATLFGFGTWVAFGQGRMLISQNGTYTAGSTGGSATTTLVEANLPSHSHSATTTISDPGHNHSTTWNNINDFNQGSNSPGAEASPDDTQGTFSITSNNNTTGITASTSIGNTGSGTAATTISPYISVYMWNRTV